MPYPPAGAAEPLGAEKAAALISDRWFISVLHALMPGQQRYSDLHRALPGISKKMLTQTLRRMEADGLVDRREGEGYALTELGESLVPAVQSLCRWAQARFGEIEARRAAAAAHDPRMIG